MAELAIMSMHGKRTVERFQADQHQVSPAASAEANSLAAWQREDVIAARAVVGIMAGVFLAALALYGGIAIYIACGGS